MDFYLQCVAVGFQEAAVRADAAQCIISIYFMIFQELKLNV